MLAYVRVLSAWQALSEGSFGCSDRASARGGPLLTELLSRTSAKDLALRYPDVSEVQDSVTSNERVRWLFRYGHVGEPEGRLARLDAGGSAQGEPLWSNAEDFIEYLDASALEEEKGGPLVRAHRIADIQRTEGGTPILAQMLRDSAPAPRSRFSRSSQPRGSAVTSAQVALVIASAVSLAAGDAKKNCGRDDDPDDATSWP
jgi:hypothetical protein